MVIDVNGNLKKATLVCMGNISVKSLHVPIAIALTHC